MDKEKVNGTRRSVGRRLRVPGLLLLSIGSWAAYLPLNAPRYPIHSTWTFIDAYVPFVPCFVLPYLAFFPFLWSTMVWRAVKEDRFASVTASFVLINAASALTYLFWQTHVNRPPLLAHGSLCVELIRLVYANDRPYNCFPSLHVSGSVFAALVLWRFHHRWRIAGAALAVLICASTVLVGQHYVLDVVAGACLAFGCVALVEWVQRKVGNLRVADG